MRRPQLALLIAGAALAAAACTSAAQPGWTYAPPTPAPTPGPSVEASAAPSDAAPSEAAPSDGGAAGGDTVAISALNIQFEQKEVTAPADTPFVIAFDNKEAVPHNVEIKDASGISVFKGDIVTGPTVVNYQVGALPAGSYSFVCTVHPNMTGTLTAG